MENARLESADEIVGAEKDSIWAWAASGHKSILV